MTPKEALESVRQAYTNAVNNRDLDALVELHTEESVSMPAGAPPLEGRDAIRELMQTSLSAMPPDVRFEFEPTEVRIAEGWAIERGVTKAADPFPAGKYVLLYEEESDGCWRIAWTITNTDSTPPPR